MWQVQGIIICYCREIKIGSRLHEKFCIFSIYTPSSIPRTYILLHETRQFHMTHFLFCTHSWHKLMCYWGYDDEHGSMRKEPYMQFDKPRPSIAHALCKEFQCQGRAGKGPVLSHGHLSYKWQNPRVMRGCCARQQVRNRWDWVISDRRVNEGGIIFTFIYL